MNDLQPILLNQFVLGITFLTYLLNILYCFFIEKQALIKSILKPLFGYAFFVYITGVNFFLLKPFFHF